MQSYKESKPFRFNSVFVLRLLTFIFFVVSLILLNHLFNNKQSNIENAILNSKRVELRVSPFGSSSKDNKFSDYSDEDDYAGDIYYDDITSGVVGEKNYLPKITLSNTSQKPAIILIVKDLGLNIKNSKAAINLPAEVNLGFSPYSKSLQELQKIAKNKGHQLLMHLPLELGTPILNNAGPYGLSESISDSDNLKRLNKMFDLAGDSQFIYSDKDEVFTNDIENSKFLINNLKNSGKYLIYGNGNDNSVFNELVSILDYSIISSDRVIDGDLNYDDIYKQLNQIEELAKTLGVIVVTANINPIMISVLSKWTSTLGEKKIELLPISKIIMPDNNE